MGLLVVFPHAKHSSLVIVEHRVQFLFVDFNLALINNENFGAVVPLLYDALTAKLDLFLIAEKKKAVDVIYVTI